MSIHYSLRLKCCISYDISALSRDAFFCIYAMLYSLPHHFHHYKPGLNRHGHESGFLKVSYLSIFYWLILPWLSCLCNLNTVLLEKLEREVWNHGYWCGFFYLLLNDPHSLLQRFFFFFLSILSACFDYLQSASLLHSTNPHGSK